MNIEKKYFSIGEVAEQLGVATSLIRFWETQFEQLKPRKTKNGIRHYTKADIELLKYIYHLVKEKGYTLQGASEALLQEKRESKAPSKKEIAQQIEALQRLKKFLTDLKENIG